MNDIGFKITAEVTHHVVNFLDLTLDLKNQTFSPFRKPNNDPLYVDNRSNHPPSIINHIPSSINKRISSLSSDQASFDSAAPFYEDALKRSNYDVYLCNTRPVTIPPICHLPTEDVVETSFGLIHPSARQFEPTSVEISYS